MSTIQKSVLLSFDKYQRLLTAAQGTTKTVHQPILTPKSENYNSSQNTTYTATVKPPISNTPPNKDAVSFQPKQKRHRPPGISDQKSRKVPKKSWIE